MAVPAFLSSSYFYHVITNTDVQEIMDDFADQVLNHNTPAWTNPATDRYKSPVDAGGRFFEVLFTRVNATTLQADTIDQYTVTVAQRRMVIVTGGLAMIFSGQYHYAIDVIPGLEFLSGGLLDLSPESQTIHTHNCYACGGRNNSSTAGNNTVEQAAMVDNVTAGMGARCSLYMGDNVNATAYITISGARLHRPREFHCTPTGGGSYRYAGRAYQTLLVPYNLDQSTELTIPIDSGVNGVFKVLRGVYQYGGHYLAVRIG